MDDFEKETGMSEEEYERQFQEATRRGAEEMKRRPKALGARYDKASKRVVFDMQNGVTFMIPVNLIQGLESGNDETLSDFDLMMQNSEIHWNALDAQFYIGDLMRGVFGTQKWMSNLSEHLASIGRKGGSSRSPAKRAASAENGKKGGRPRKKKTA